MVESGITVPERRTELLSQLDKTEKTKLEKLERVISDGLQTFVDVGNALWDICESRLYRGEHPSFGAYCRERWGMTKTHAHRLIAGAKVCENIKQIGPVPVAESVVRPLTSLPRDRQVEVWTAVVERKPQAITANLVTRVMNEVGGNPGRRPVRHSDRVLRGDVLAVLDGWEEVLRGIKGKKTPGKVVAALRQRIVQL